MLVVRHIGGQLLRGVGTGGYDNVNGKFLYKAGDKIAKENTGKALREGLSMRYKMIPIRGHVSSQVIVNSSDKTVMDHQETVTQISSSVSDHLDHSGWSRQGCLRIYSFDGGC